MSSRFVSLSLVLAACGGPASTSPDASGDVLDAGDSGQPRCISPVHDRQWGGSGDDDASVAISRTGAIYVFGSTHGAANDDIAPGTGASGYLDRYDGDTRLWSFTDPSINSFDLVKPALDGSLEVVGRSAQGNQLDLAIGSLSADGHARGFERAGSAPSERPFQLLADGDQRAIVGYHDVYVPTNFVEAWEDPFVFRWNVNAGPAAGTLATLHSNESDIATGAAFAADGSVLVAGASLNGDGSWVRPSTSGLGEPVWKTVGDLEELREIHRLADGDFIIAGTTMRALGTAVGGQDVFVARLAPDLATTRWVTQLGSAGDDRALDLAIDDTGRTWILGETTGDVAAPHAGEYDLFVIALDESGTERWRVQRGSEGDERPTALAVDACENVLVAGATSGPLVAPASRYDAFLLSVRPD
ncbi:MAG: hypothetical protein HOV81_15030 [Kofleriaceae bacterium]|nr:hypothetical protein [Kofleriaceae bacterium]